MLETLKARREYLYNFTLIGISKPKTEEGHVKVLKFGTTESTYVRLACNIQLQCLKMAITAQWDDTQRAAKLEQKPQEPQIVTECTENDGAGNLIKAKWQSPEYHA